MSKRAEELAKQLYPDPKLEDYDDILVYRADRDNALMGRANVVCVYEQAERDLADAFQAEYAKELARADLALTIEDIRLIIQAYYDTNRIEREARGEGGLYEFSETPDYLHHILMRYNYLKNELPQTEQI